MSGSRAAEARQLFEAGTRDRLACGLLIETGRAPPESVGFLAQQACEKLIKTRIVLSGGVVNRTHDLDYLADLAEQRQAAVPADRNLLRQLNPYAVAYRYESGHELSLDAGRILELLDALHQWCESALRAAESG